MARITERQQIDTRKFEIKQIFAQLDRVIPDQASKLAQTVKDQITWYYQNNFDSRRKPKTIAVILLDYYRDQYSTIISHSFLVQHFFIDIGHLRRSRVKILKEFGIEFNTMIPNSYSFKLEGRF